MLLAEDVALGLGLAEGEALADVDALAEAVGDKVPLAVGLALA